MARDVKQTAAMYAAMKVLERALDDDGELPPGFYLDVSGQEVTVKFPNGTVVERDRGMDGDGIIWKKATQNLYGFAFFTLMVRKLVAFKQWNVVRAIIIDTVREALKNGISSRAEIRAEDPVLALEIDKLHTEFPTPQRKEQTPRKVTQSKLPPTITVTAK